jgi:hypothetical protein
MRSSGMDRLGWEDNIKMDLKDIRMYVMDLIDTAQDKASGVLLWNAVMNDRFLLMRGSS